VGRESNDAASRFGWLRDELRYRPLWILLGVAIALRVATLALYFPAAVQWGDGPRYARAGAIGIFEDPWTPSLYPIFLAGLRAISDQLAFTIAVQHALGVLAGLSLYLALRRLEAPRLLALIPAGVLLLSGDVVYLEHTVLTDQFALVLTTLALSAAIFGLRPTLALPWLAVAGALAAGAWVTRSPFLMVLLVIVVAAALVGSGARERLLASGAVALGAGLIIGAYLLAYALDNSQKYLGLSDMTGWTLYSRVAQFADCSQFDPPEESRVLCEDTPPGERGGRQFYLWDLNSVARTSTDISPETDGTAYGFAVDAIRAQPLDYLNAVATDLARYVRDPQPSRRFESGRGRDDYSFSSRVPLLEGIGLHGPAGDAGLASVYDGTRLHIRGSGPLGTYQRVMRLHGVLLVAFLLLAIAGAILGRRMRLGILLFGSAGLLLYLFPTAVAGYELRFGVAPSVLLACAGILGAYALVPLTRESRFQRSAFASWISARSESRS
jgi:hypothetical protein